MVALINHLLTYLLKKLRKARARLHESARRAVVVVARGTARYVMPCCHLSLHLSMLWSYSMVVCRHYCIIDIDKELRVCYVIMIAICNLEHLCYDG